MRAAWWTRPAPWSPCRLPRMSRGPAVPGCRRPRPVPAPRAGRGQGARWTRWRSDPSERPVRTPAWRGGPGGERRACGPAAGGGGGGRIRAVSAPGEPAGCGGLRGGDAPGRRVRRPRHDRGALRRPAVAGNGLGRRRRGTARSGAGGAVCCTARGSAPRSCMQAARGGRGAHRCRAGARIWRPAGCWCRRPGARAERPAGVRRPRRAPRGPNRAGGVPRGPPGRCRDGLQRCCGGCRSPGRMAGCLGAGRRAPRPPEALRWR